MKRFIAAFVLFILLVASLCSAQTTAQAALPGLHKSVLDQKDAVPNTATAASPAAAVLPGAPLARDPIFVYNNRSAYDQLSDNIPRDESYAGATGVLQACPERSRRVQSGGNARPSTTSEK